MAAACVTSASLLSWSPWGCEALAGFPASLNMQGRGGEPYRSDLGSFSKGIKGHSAFSEYDGPLT